MGWLIACPHHKTGIFGFVIFFGALFYQPVINGKNEQLNFLKKTLTFFRFKFEKSSFFKGFSYNIELNLGYQLLFFYVFNVYVIHIFLLALREIL
jgi:hypothetical protein